MRYASFSFAFAAVAFAMARVFAPAIIFSHSKHQQKINDARRTIGEVVAENFESNNDFSASRFPAGIPSYRTADDKPSRHADCHQSDLDELSVSAS
jgi:hypothetical protein